jgi:hypothetical protein
MIFYHQPDEDAPMATAVLHLTGIGECPPAQGEWQGLSL